MVTLWASRQPALVTCLHCRECGSWFRVVQSGLFLYSDGSNLPAMGDLSRLGSHPLALPTPAGSTATGHSYQTQLNFAYFLEEAGSGPVSTPGERCCLRQMPSWAVYAYHEPQPPLVPDAHPAANHSRILVRSCHRIMQLVTPYSAG